MQDILVEFLYLQCQLQNPRETTIGYIHIYDFNCINARVTTRAKIYIYSVNLNNERDTTLGSF